MNIGQVLEVHLGWAAFGLGWRIAEMLKHERSKQVAEIREFLNTIYNKSSGKKEDFDSLTDDEIIDLAKHLRRVCRLQPPYSTAQAKAISVRCSILPSQKKPLRNCT